MLKKIIGLGLVLIVVVLGILVNLRKPALPQEARQTLDDFVQRFAGPGFAYKVVSAEQAMTPNQDNSEKLASAPIFGGEKRPAGICPPDAPQVKESWCLIIDKQVPTSLGDRFTHFIVQRQGQLWLVDGVSESDADVFQTFGCKW